VSGSLDWYPPDRFPFDSLTIIRTYGAAVDSHRIVALIITLVRAVQRLLRPARSGGRLVIGAAGDLTRTRSELLAENALLRQQVLVLRRNIDRPRLHRDDRLLLLALARLTRRWRDAMHVVSPETLLR
ncbi:MAG: hypothetical protein GY944_08225, partial [bacterium]|nr:hypothetical protein [bacterium]